MTTTTKPTTTQHTGSPDIEKTRWRIDPARSSVEFRTPTFWGLVTVKGRFERYDGTLDLRRDPAIDLTIEAASLDTKNKTRDKHLRAVDFFDAEHHPVVRFASDDARLEGEHLKVRGQLHARGYSMPIELEAEVRRVGDELEVDSTTLRQPARARHDAQPAGHDPHPERAGRARPAGSRLGQRGVTTMAATSTPRQRASGREPGLRSAAQSGLDVMLTDAVLEDGGVSRFVKPRAAGRTMAGLVRHPRRTARDASGLGMELARVAAGRSAIWPRQGRSPVRRPGVERQLGCFVASCRAISRPVTPSTD